VTDQGSKRCPSCGALAAADADWCGQCYHPLTPPKAARREHAVAVGSGPAQFYMDEPPSAVSVGALAAPEPPVELPKRAPTWPCAVCGTDNQLERDTCAVCGASFGKLFDEQRAKPQTSPKEAVARSLLFPGLGHLHAGKASEGLARMVLFLWAVGTAAVMLLGSAGHSSSALVPLGIFFLVVALFLYASSAFDAYRIAAGDRPLLSTRALLYGTVVLIMISVGALFVLVTRAAQIPR
jgi:hypothetical protein